MADKNNTPNKNWFSQHKKATAITAIVLIIIIAVSTGSGKPQATVNTSASSSKSDITSQPPKKTSQTVTNSVSNTPAPQRQVKGTATTLGAGTFTVGKDIAVGLYDVTAPSGQSGNFIVDGSDGTNLYNEVLGDPTQGDVSKVRTNLPSGASVQISGMSGVTFTPVTAAYVTAHATTNLYAGSFIVGQDIGPGRYVATPASGESGNFFVYDNSGSAVVNEILGGSSSDGGVPSVTTTLSNGEVVQVSGIDSVTMTASN